MKNQFKNLVFSLSVLIFILVGFVCYEVIKNNSLNKKFDSTELNLTVSQLKSTWGIPDAEFKHNENLILKYSDYIDWGNYIFVFDIKKNKLIGKFYDD